MNLPRKRLSFTQACNEWDKERKQLVRINGHSYKWECSKRHTHNGYCLTQSMLDALSELVYANAK